MTAVARPARQSPTPLAKCLWCYWRPRARPQKRSWFARALGVPAIVLGILKRGETVDHGSFEDHDKNQLWKDYGHHFGSKAEARQFYNDYHEKRRSKRRR